MELHAEGKRVELFGLNKKELNGKTGVLRSFGMEHQRYLVQLDEPAAVRNDQKPLRSVMVKPINIRAANGNAK